MGAGTTTLLMYALCCGSVGVTVGIAAGLYGWGRLQERRRRDRNSSRQDPPAAA